MTGMTTSGKSAAQLLVEARTGRDLETMLRDLYIARRWTDQEIADHLRSTYGLDVSRTSINAWRVDLGIDRSQRRTVLEEPVS